MLAQLVQPTGSDTVHVTQLFSSSRGFRLDAGYFDSIHSPFAPFAPFARLKRFSNCVNSFGVAVWELETILSSNLCNQIASAN